MRKQNEAKTLNKDSPFDSLKVGESLLIYDSQNGYFATLRSAQYDEKIRF